MPGMWNAACWVTGTSLPGGTGARAAEAKYRAGSHPLSQPARDEIYLGLDAFLLK